MPAQSRPLGVGNVLFPEALTQYLGQYGIQESGLPQAPYQGAESLILSGGVNNFVADLTYNQTADVTLVAAAPLGVPSNLRFHLTDLSINVHGAVAWAGGNYIYVKDTGGALLAYLPLVSLKAFQNVTLPVAGCSAFPNVKALATPYYVASTGVLTLASSSLTTTTLAGVPLTVVGGTGKGQSGIISSNTATTITMTTPFATALDSTSVIGIGYYSATAADSTTLTDSKAVWASGQFTGGNWYVVQITGTYAGQVTPIVSNTGTVITVTAWPLGTPSAADLFCATQVPQLMGAICPAAQYDWTYACAPGKGLVAGISGTFTGSTSSPIRVKARGFNAQ